MSTWISRGAALAVGFGAAVTAAGALAHDDPMPKNPTPAQRAAYVRHDHFQELDKAFKAVGDELKKSAPDKAVLASSARMVATMADAIPSWFPRGSGVEARPMSGAKANIWTDAAGFGAKAADLQAEALKLSQAAANGDVAGVKAQYGPVGGACQACHDTYRSGRKM
ncbi:cytochrome c [uncultured Phenylobacterium sp.]|uniref:c-type cytochrome n=1 Tax=uncultured Phenylobacterium sp. TaxID=349273 RepID=UPI0025F13C65|nr:cytochrome c [uncultured Phenylobacterium sp.]